MHGLISILDSCVLHGWRERRHMLEFADNHVRYVGNSFLSAITTIKVELRAVTFHNMPIDCHENCFIECYIVQEIRMKFLCDSQP
jgi:hypothetical protein